MTNLDIPHSYYHTIVLGSGAASLNAAGRLHGFGVHDLVIITLSLEAGTSRNTGSDKQTYCRVADGGSGADSALGMAKALFNGGAVHGDIAMAEAAGSLRSFYHLVELGVEFPHDRLGRYVGYKTDHDELQRGSSTGPFTSRSMVENLVKDVERRGIPVREKTEVVKLLCHDHRAVGVIVQDRRKLRDEHYGLEVVFAENIVFGLGGPGGLYRDSVYPHRHSGGIGLALEAGATAANLTESQFGLASIKHRWNVSGTYQQVLPRYVSTDQDGQNPREFLPEEFPSPDRFAEAVFLKGYQWPFDPRKVDNFGSSLIDLLVFRETTERGRRVFLDYRTNPGSLAVGGELVAARLGEESRDYLARSRALGGTPLERLRIMNPEAIEMYRQHGIDLETEMLEIAVCAQHNNGGLAADVWWESVNLRRLFPVGEINGSHGVYRPGGSALNSGQVGSLRAAQRIAHRYGGRDLDVQQTLAAVAPSVAEFHDWVQASVGGDGAAALTRLHRDIQSRMSDHAGHVRGGEGLDEACDDARATSAAFAPDGGLKVSRWQLPRLLRIRHLVVAHRAYLEAVRDYVEHGGGSRGSYVVLEARGDGSQFRPPAAGQPGEVICTTMGADGTFTHERVPRRPLPEEAPWFETEWARYRSGAIYDG